MKPTTLVLVRHAHVSDEDCGPDGRLCGWFDPPLSPLGRRQAALVAARCAVGPSPAALYASPSKRAAATAEPIGDALGLEPCIVPALREIGCGELDGLPIEVVQRLYATVWRANLRQDDEDFRWPGGESYREFRTRALAVSDRLARAHAGARVLIVTHAGVITQLLGARKGLNAAAWERFRAGHASVTELCWTGGPGPLIRFDDRGHLAI